MKKSLITLCMFIITLNIIFITANTEKMTQSEFENLSYELSIMMENSDIFYIGENNSIMFNEEIANKKGFSPKSILLSKELTELSNEIVKQKTLNIKNKKSFTKDSPSIMNLYFESAKVYSKQNLNKKENPHFRNYVNADETEDPEKVCGSWSNPFPEKGEDWKLHYVDNPEDRLRRVGYHETNHLDEFGGGWTRPQTYKEYICGKDTFRDHAWIEITSSGTKIIHEQEYTNAPYGEPNPESILSFPTNWPYITWPAYVYWWHGNF